MGQPYSAWADWLDKFDKTSEGIQALWILAGTVTVLGLTFIVVRGLVEVVRFWAISQHCHSETAELGPETIHAAGSRRELSVELHSASPARLGSGLRFAAPE